MHPPLVRASKFLSLVLRHDPGKIGLALDAAGWAEVDELIAAAARAGVDLDRETLARVVAENDKQRFALSPDGRRIRANQGHSVTVDLGLEPRTPPELLFHGTASRFVDSIRASGLHAASRAHVHLSADPETARTVGQRHGSPVVLTVAAGRMHRDGRLFFRSANGVWLTDAVPAEYIELGG
jgi:putative RNA 2'-phosphotransferase